MWPVLYSYVVMMVKKCFNMYMFLGVPHAFMPHEHLLKRVVKFLSCCLQISVGAHVLTIGEPIGAVEVTVLTSQTQCTSLVECDK